jgi:hypothetical protein
MAFKNPWEKEVFRVWVRWFFFKKKKKLEKHTETHGSVVWYISTITPFLSVERDGIRDGIACYNYVHNLM